MKKSLISAIKKLLAKLGAEEIEGNNLVEVIDSGADAIEGGGGGNNVLKLYVKNFTDTNIIAYKDSAKTQQFTSYSEAKAAIETADRIVFTAGKTEDIGQASYVATCV